MNQLGPKPGLVKLYLRIGEVAELVGVQPHVLRYWETEFRGAIRPQKSKKGQRVYSRQDVERLLKVKDLLRNQGFTIAGARKVLREGVSAKSETTPVSAGSATAASAVAASAVAASATQAVSSAAQVTPLRPVAPVSSSVIGAPAVVPAAVALAPVTALPHSALPAPPAVVWAASDEQSEQAEQPVPVQTIALSEPTVASVSDVAAERAPMFELVLPTAASGDRSAKRLRRALVDLRQEVVSAIKDLG